MRRPSGLPPRPSASPPRRPDAIFGQIGISLRQAGIGKRKIGVEPDGSLVAFDCLKIRLGRLELIEKETALLVELVGFRISCRRKPPNRSLAKFVPDCLGDLILNGENVAQGAVVFSR